MAMPAGQCHHDCTASMPTCELCARHGSSTHLVLQVLGKKHNEMGAADKVAPAQFVAAWKALGVKVQQHMATAIFSKHGHDAAGRMPVQVRNCCCTCDLLQQRSGGLRPRCMPPALVRPMCCQVLM